MTVNCPRCDSPKVVQLLNGARVCTVCENRFHVFEMDPSTLNTEQDCFFKFELGSIRQLELTAGKGEGFQRGDIVHAALRVYYHQMLKHVNWTTRTEQGLAYAKIIATTKSLEFDDLHQVMQTMKEYFIHVKDDTWTPRAVEVPFRKTVWKDDELILVIVGKIDLEVDTGAQNNHMILPVDHKSGIDVPPAELSNQFMCYSYVGEYTHFCVNKISFAEHKKLSPEARAEKKFRRHMIPYSKAELNNWLKNTVWWAKMAIWCIEHDTFPQNFTSCDKYSGCQFGHICKGDPDNRDYKIKSMYRKREKEWHPETAEVGPEELDRIIAEL